MPDTTQNECFSVYPLFFPTYNIPLCLFPHRTHTCIQSILANVSDSFSSPTSEILHHQKLEYAKCYRSATRWSLGHSGEKYRNVCRGFPQLSLRRAAVQRQQKHGIPGRCKYSLPTRPPAIHVLTALRQAVMTSPPSATVPQPAFCKKLKWPTSPPFRIRWICTTSVHFKFVGHLRNMHNPNDDGEPHAVLVGKDGQEVSTSAGKGVVEILRARDGEARGEGDRP